MPTRTTHANPTGVWFGEETLQTQELPPTPPLSMPYSEVYELPSSPDFTQDPTFYTTVACTLCHTTITCPSHFSDEVLTCACCSVQQELVSRTKLINDCGEDQHINSRGLRAALAASSGSRDTQISQGLSLMISMDGFLFDNSSRYLATFPPSSALTLPPSYTQPGRTLLSPQTATLSSGIPPPTPGNYLS